MESSNAWPAMTQPAPATRPTTVAVPVALATARRQSPTSTPLNRTARASVARPREAASTIR